jgi:hypothetical protein
MLLLPHPEIFKSIFKGSSESKISCGSKEVLRIGEDLCLEILGISISVQFHGLFMEKALPCPLLMSFSFSSPLVVVMRAIPFSRRSLHHASEKNPK